MAVAMYRPAKIGIFLSLCFMLMAIPYHMQGQAYMTKTGHAEFDSSVPLHSFTGKSDHLVGKINLDDSTVDFYLDVNTLETGISKRDKDMLETLKAEEYPFAEFFGQLASSFEPDKNGSQQVTVEGEFTVHGVTKDLTVEGSLEKTSEGLQVNAAWTINMEDYDIEPPGILFYRVSEEIDIRIDALLKPTDE
jgi:polyisoprenoid-binding protein YceI